MNFIILEAKQRSAEWFKNRAGRLTGSKACYVTDFLKSGKESAARRDYRLQLVCERLTGLPQDSADGFVNAAMQRGIELEPAAFAAYEALTGQVAHKSGFLAHNTLMVGCSLDGHVDGFKGLIEIKCPKTATHLGYWRGPRVIPEEHLPQVLHNLWVTGAEWCDFMSFDDRLPADMQTFLVRVTREEVDIAGYEKAALAFLAEVDAEVKELQSRRAA